MCIYKVCAPRSTVMDWKAAWVEKIASPVAAGKTSLPR